VSREFFLLLNFRPPHASPGFLPVCTNHSYLEAGVAGNRALTERVVRRARVTPWPVLLKAPEKKA
jgi:hypothetical protein